MGLRQSLGIFLQPLTQDIAHSVSDFTLAIADAKSGLGIPAAARRRDDGATVFAPIMMAGALFYIAGLALMACAQGLVSIMIGAGVLIGMSLACTAAAIAIRLRRARCRPRCAARCSVSSRRRVRSAR